MSLKHQYDKQDEIPEQYRDLFSEKAGKWELTGVSGIKTQADVDRVSEALRKEKADHKKAQEQLKAWVDLGELDDVQGRLAKVTELEAASNGKLDETAIEKVLKVRMGPVEKQLKTLAAERDALKAQNEEFSGRERRRTVHDAIRKAAELEKLRPEAIEDALVLGERVFEVAENGEVTTRDGVGVTPGLQAKDWLGEIRDKRPHWWPGSTGGGATGSGPRSGVPTGADNPWSAEGWNLTKQGQVLRELGTAKAEAYAKAAGTAVGAGRPRPATQAAPAGQQGAAAAGGTR